MMPCRDSFQFGNRILGLFVFLIFSSMQVSTEIAAFPSLKAFRVRWGKHVSLYVEDRMSCYTVECEHSLGSPQIRDPCLI